jgi:hypothetical protein
MHVVIRIHSVVPTTGFQQPIRVVETVVSVRRLLGTKHCIGVSNIYHECSGRPTFSLVIKGENANCMFPRTPPPPPSGPFSLFREFLLIFVSLPVSEFCTLLQGPVWLCGDRNHLNSFTTSYVDSRLQNMPVQEKKPTKYFAGCIFWKHWMSEWL